MDKKFDVIIVGGGLSGGLLAYRLFQKKPNLKIIVLEKSQNWGGVHTWSFHESDITFEQHQWLKPLVSRSWPHYEVIFPNYRRQLSKAPYYSIRSEDFDRKLKAELGSILKTGEVVESSQYSVRLKSGETLDAHCVIDARGFSAKSFKCAYQKFVGLDVKTKNPHGITHPFLMDATVDQNQGYRFIYLLPWDSHSLLIEDTYYSDNSELDESALRKNILAYAQEKGWEIESIQRSEVGCLPIPLSKARQDLNLPTIGVRGGLFHFTTGYSLPDAVRVADGISALTQLSPLNITTFLKSYLVEKSRSDGFYLLLNRMLFGAATPSKRIKVMNRFYQLPDPVIHHFYSGQLTWKDKARILSGKPPVNIFKAIGAAVGF